MIPILIFQEKLDTKIKAKKMLLKDIPGKWLVLVTKMVMMIDNNGSSCGRGG